MEIEFDSKWAQLAAKHWKTDSAASNRVRGEVVKIELWDELEKTGFRGQDLVALENLQLLEQYLWPGYNEASSDHHILLIAIMITTKRKEGLSVWDLFQSNIDGFSSLFRRLLSMSVDDSVALPLQTHILSFLIAAFQSLEVGIVRKECASLVSISTWHHLHSDTARDARMEQSNMMRKAWRTSARRFEAADEATKGRLLFERSWLYTKIVNFIDMIYDADGLGQAATVYCERFIEFLTDLESQLPTRRYVNTLLKNLSILPIIRKSPMHDKHSNGLFRDLYALLRHFINFPIDDESGQQYTIDEAADLRSKALARLQRTALKHFKEKLTLLALSNYGTLGLRNELQNYFKVLTDDELSRLATVLGFRVLWPDCQRLVADRSIITEALVSSYEKQKSFKERVAAMNVTPTEVDLYDPSLMRNEHYDGSHSLAIPKLNLQYLTVGDFLWRSFILYRCETFFQIRGDMEDIVERLQPRIDTRDNSIRFSGSSRMALPITQPAILEVATPKVGDSVPGFVRAEVTLNVSRLARHALTEWDQLKPGDVVYLLAIKPKSEGVNGHTENSSTDGHRALLHLRTAEVVHIQEESGKTVKDVKRDSREEGEYNRRPRIRRLIVNIDPAAYAGDQVRKSSGKPDVYESINVIVRRKGRENNFKPILESIQKLTLSDVPAPVWLQEVFLGFGDPSSASYNNLSDKLAALDLRDTFLDWQHLTESMPGKKVEPDEGQPAEPQPPYVLQTVASAPAPTPASQRPSKKRRKDERGTAVPLKEAVKVKTYPSINTGPYPSDAPKRNSVRFTPAQTEAIISGTQPGLTVIVGPPGTGKTDVATQIINNLYHDFPEQRTLLIAHSNQALNQLFQKITKLDIDGRHLLRLGHGEEDLETDESYGKHGRVESFLDNRFALLSEVNRLAANLGAPGAHGNSCETAGYFRAVHVEPTWSKFWTGLKASTTPAETVRATFPFYQYFSSAPQPIFPEATSDEETVEIARGCERHIAKIFTELEDIRPFELLRSPRDRANYLLVKEARIIAMTSTHAAMRRQEIADLGFHYDNVVMEEAAQITEIENFIPLALQHPKDGALPLKRVVLCGDHYQNSPVIQNMAFRQFANLEQSMFQRFVRLGVPVTELDRQGRARASIADLYRWRYRSLGDLPSVASGGEYQLANAGMRYDWQFIDVGDFQGEGERQPTAHFVQNLGEAEYAVALYQYLRLLGHPAKRISILTTYAGQRALIRDILQRRCSDSRLFGMPRHVTTVDKYQGEQNDIVILSLVRTRRVGYLRDVRRLTVALSRARLGLYVLGRKAVFESCFELREAFGRLFKRPTTLQIVAGEMSPTRRRVDDEDVTATEMTGVEHLGQYVYDMTQAKLAQKDDDDDGEEEGGAGMAVEDEGGAGGGVRLDDGSGGGGADADVREKVQTDANAFPPENEVEGDDSDDEEGNEGGGVSLSASAEGDEDAEQKRNEADDSHEEEEEEEEGVRPEQLED